MSNEYLKQVPLKEIGRELNAPYGIADVTLINAQCPVCGRQTVLLEASCDTGRRAKCMLDGCGAWLERNAEGKYDRQQTASLLVYKSAPQVYEHVPLRPGQGAFDLISMYIDGELDDYLTGDIGDDVDSMDLECYGVRFSHNAPVTTYYDPNGMKINAATGEYPSLHMMLERYRKLAAHANALVNLITEGFGVSDEVQLHIDIIRAMIGTGRHGQS